MLLSYQYHIFALIILHYSFLLNRIAAPFLLEEKELNHSPPSCILMNDSLFNVNHTVLSRQKKYV